MIIEDGFIRPCPLPFSYLCFLRQKLTAYLLSFTGQGYQHALASSLWAVLSVGLVSAHPSSPFVIARERQEEQPVACWCAENKSRCIPLTA